jgi:tetraacyldisaccharide 4'-kinase
MNLLAPFGKLYGRIMDLRNLLYDRGALKTYSLGARTVSVGNLTTGGTGKTPLVALIAEILAENGEKVCVLTRGYGREKPRQRVLVSDGEAVLADARTGGDEPVELAQKLIGKAVIVADADRVAAAKWAREKFGITVFILDDGFQHRRAKRDLDIACIDATNPCGNGRILPAGILRESFKSLKRADAIVITRTDQVKDTTDLERRLKNRNGEAAILRSSTRIAGLINLDGNTQSEVKSPLFAFSGIGNPENFFATLRTGGFKLSGTRAFRDHHRYTQLDIEHLERTADQTGAIGLIITAKDAVKLADLKFKKPCYVVVAEMVIADPTAFRALVLSS